MQQLMTAAAIDKHWLGLPVTPVRAYAVFCEDEDTDIHIRQEAINRFYDCSYGDLENMKALPRLGFNNVMMNFENGMPETTAFFHQVLKAAGDFGAQLIAIDTSADVFGGNQNDAGQARHALVLSAIKAIDYAGLDGLADLDRSMVDELLAEVAVLAKEIEALKPTADETGKRLRRQQAFDELEARKKFSADIETFVARRNSLELLVKTKACTAACSVAGITSHITRLRRKVLTATLQASLEDEIIALDLKHLPLKLADRGEVGKSKVQIGLEAQQKVGKNSDILSEGEKRALALAGFLAELKEVGARHGIVVDDPVSSLDHARMEAVAKRLVKEAAAGRQVIIFTHNLFFHYAVLEAAQEMKVKLREEWIAKHGDGRFGIIDDSQRPWISMGVTKRLAVITELLQKKKSTYSETDETQRSFVIDLYTKLRETWEHSIEEILFAGVVGRFRPNIATMKLRSARVEKADYEAVFAGMTRCSKFSGHDQSVGVPAELPKFDVIKADLDKLSQFVATADGRRKTLEKEGKAFEEGPMAADVLD